MINWIILGFHKRPLGITFQRRIVIPRTISSFIVITKKCYIDSIILLLFHMIDCHHMRSVSMQFLKQCDFLLVLLQPLFVN